MKTTCLWAMVLMVMAIIQSCNSADKRENISDTIFVDHLAKDTTNQKGAIATTEDGIQSVMFIETVAQRGIFEVELGKLAHEKATNLRIKNFGKLMVKDHTKMNSSLKALAAARGLKLPSALPEKNQKQIRDMGKMKNDYFEKLYMKIMKEEHSKDLELFKGAQKSPDTLISNFARKYYPVLVQHQQKAASVP